MTFWEQLQAKQRRLITVPIKISNSAVDEEILMGAQVALQQAVGRDDDTGAAEQLRTRVEEAADAVRAHWADIELHAMPADQWNAAMEAYRAGEDGQVDWAQALAPLLAESCVDPDARDVDRWREMLTRPEWSEGDRDALKRGLLEVNVIAADPYFPKG